MLQIISGKFFGDGVINERQIDSILYSNYSWIAPISTTNIEVRPVDPSMSRVTAYTVKCTSRYESEPVVEGEIRQATLIHPHASPAIHQFRLLCCFYFKALFHEDRQYIETLSRPSSRHSEDRIIPSRFIPRYFDLSISGSHAEVTEFPAFVDSIIAIPRHRFKVFMSCLETFCDALEVVGTNFDLAYSMFIYLLETISKDGDEYVPRWCDYNQRTATKLDAVFESLDTAAATAIKDILLDDAQLKLTQRFVEGIASLIGEPFFVEESAGRSHAVTQSQLREVLRNAYASRSGYVHELRTVQQHIRQAELTDRGASDVFIWDNKPYLLISGLVRLAHHALRSYVTKQPKLEKETFADWRHELPGIITMKLDPKYWLWRKEGISGETAHGRFSGAVVHFLSAFQATDAPITDLREVIAKIEDILVSTKSDQRRSLLGIYVLWNTVIVESAKSAKRKTVLARYSKELGECTIQNLAVTVMLHDGPVSWSGVECAACCERYYKQRFKPSGVALPRLLEIALTVEVANRFLDANDTTGYSQWMRRARLDAGGLSEVQTAIALAKSANARLCVHSILGIAKPKCEVQPVEYVI